MANTFAQSNIWANKFFQTMNDSNGISMKMLIEQRQYDNASTEVGQIEILKKKHFILDLPYESVYVVADTIKTWNKTTNQLIIDQNISRGVNIFDILTGSFEEIEFGIPKESKNYVQMDFNVPQLGYGGELIIQANGVPNLIRLIYGPNQAISLTIQDFQKGNLKLYDGFNPDGAEVIDLRE